MGQKKKVNNDDLVDYVVPELENLKALFTNLHLQKSLLALSLLEQVVRLETTKATKSLQVNTRGLNT